MPTTVQVDENGVASFRKSLYDEEGDAITLHTVELIEVDGVAVEEGPARSPAWLTGAYATTDEPTTEGPLGSRRYLHLDFDVDTAHPAIEKNTSYKIRINADDAFNDPQDFDFVFTNGVLDFSTLTGLVGHFANRLQGAEGDVLTLTNYGAGGDAPRVGTADQAVGDLTAFSGRGAFLFDRSHYAVPGGLLPTASPNDPWSIFHLVRLQTISSGGLRFLWQESAMSGVRVNRDSANLSVLFFADGITTTRSLSNAFATGGYALIEVHKAGDGTVAVLCNGAAVGAPFTHAAAMPVEDLQIGANASFHNHIVMELLVVDGELSGSQKTQVRKALKALYPVSTHPVV